VTTLQAGTAGTQYLFTNWSDSGAASHSIPVGVTTATYAAVFKTQYQLTISASPASDGTVTPASGAFYDAGTAVLVSATASSGFAFTSWTGSVADSSSSSTTVTMSAPQTLAANFSSSAGGHPAFFAGEAALSGTIYYLQFADGNLFGYYGYLSSSILYHQDMGYEAFVPSTGGSIYFYDFASGHWWYTSPSLDPYLYDFTLGAWIYYFPDATHPGHYTTSPRYFVNLTTRVVFTL
jgi:List-Bact-rpt repeat protein